jgi:hypothetical protein
MSRGSLIRQLCALIVLACLGFASAYPLGLGAFALVNEFHLGTSPK